MEAMVFLLRPRCLGNANLRIWLKGCKIVAMKP